VAEERVAEPVDVDHARLAEGGEKVTLSAIDLGCRPRRRGSLDRLLVIEGLDDPAVGVAAHEDGAIAERAQQLDRLLRKRSRHGVAADEDAVDVFALDLGEHGAQRDGVAVDVVEGRDAHGRYSSAPASAR
jgi:hypothetical protein